ncbi:MAG: PucC protein, partial [uncultured Craurococcus sp.]
ELHDPRLDQARPRVPPLRRRRLGGAAARAPAAPLALPGLGRHVLRAADRHAEPRDDRRARRLRLAGGDDGLAAAALRPIPRAGRAPVGQPPLRARLAPRPLPLDGHAAAIRRPGDHALRAHPALGRQQRAADRRPYRRGAGLPAGGRRAAYHADGRPRARDRPRPTGVTAPRRRPALADAAPRHAGERRRVRRAAAAFQPAPAHPGDPGRGAADDGAELHRPLEAGAARPGPYPRRPPAARLPRILAAAARRGTLDPPPRRRRPRLRRLQHAGHPARALWRPDPRPFRCRDDDADRALRERRHRRLRHGRPRPRPRLRPASPRRLRRAGGCDRLRRRHLRRTPRQRGDLRPRHGGDRPRQRPLHRRHAHRLHGPRPQRPGRPCARRLGRGAGELRRRRRRRRRGAARHRLRARHARRPRRHPHRRRHRLRRGLHARDRAAFCHHRRDRPARQRRPAAAFNLARPRRVPEL